MQYEAISLKDELRAKNKLIEDQRFEIDRLAKNSTQVPISNELEAEYNKFLNQKEQLINKLSKALKDTEDENMTIKSKAERERE